MTRPSRICGLVELVSGSCLLSVFSYVILTRSKVLREFKIARLLLIRLEVVTSGTVSDVARECQEAFRFLGVSSLQILLG